MEEYDVVIIGAGIAGKTLAYLLANEGWNIALIDIKSSDEIGKRACGGGVSKDIFSHSIFKKIEPRGNEILSNIEYFRLQILHTDEIMYSRGAGFIIDRFAYEQRILREILSKGVILYDKSLVIHPKIKDNKLTGLSVKKLGSNKVTELKSKLVVDATGSTRSLFRILFPKLNMSTHSFYYLAIRDILENKISNFRIKTNTCYIFFENDKNPSGYWWIFPRGNDELNIGVGSLIQDGENVKVLLNYLYNTLDLNNKCVSGCTRGGYIISGGRPLEQFVYNGFTLIGEAAGHINTLQLEGIRWSFLSAYFLYKTLIEYSDQSIRLFEMDNLWPYAKSFMSNYGWLLYILNIEKTFLGSLTNEELKLLFENDLISNLFIYSIRPLNIHVFEDDMWWENSGIKNFLLIKKGKLLGKIALVRNEMLKFYNVLRFYPNSPKEINYWKDKINSIFNKIYLILK